MRGTELSKDSRSDFLPAHLRDRCSSRVTCDADFVVTPTGTIGVCFVVSLVRDRGGGSTNTP